MSDKLKIKLSIADRVYPLSIAPSQEEGLRKATKNIEAMIKQLEKSYAVRDKQDVLAMCALQLAAQSEQVNIDKIQDTDAAVKKAAALNELLDQYLS